MKKFPVFYQGLRKSNEYGGSLKNKRFAIVEFDEDVNGSYERLCEIVDTLRKEFGYEIPFVDCGFCHAEVEDVEEFYQFRNDFREVEKRRFYDPEQDKLVNENVPKHQYEWFSQQSWFNKTYEEFLADNFRKVR